MHGGCRWIYDSLSRAFARSFYRHRGPDERGSTLWSVDVYSSVVVRPRGVDTERVAPRTAIPRECTRSAASPVARCKDGDMMLTADSTPSAPTRTRDAGTAPLDVAIIPRIYTATRAASNRRIYTMS